MKKLTSHLIIKAAITFWVLTPIHCVAAETYFFDENLLLGDGYNSELLKKISNGPQAEPGVYQLDVYINASFYGSHDVYLFVSDESEHALNACLSGEFYQQAGVLPDVVRQSQSANCESGVQIEGVTEHIDIAKLRLNLGIPQAYLVRHPRGYVDSSQWDAGEPVFFSNYTYNYYHANSNHSNGQEFRSDSQYLGLSSGLNLGLWHLRNISNYQRANNSGQTKEQFNSIRTYLSRPVSRLNGEVIVGESYTSGTFLGSIGFVGLQFKSDSRMLPESQRGYAPVVNGVANSTAKVIVRQNGRDIYQTTVPRGPFSISDLYPTSYEGDLDVEVIEADGSSSHFQIPFNAVPGSLRPDLLRYDISVGRTDDTQVEKLFADLTLERGISNTITGNTAVRLSDHYLAMSLGGVYGSSLGAFGSNVVFSHSDTPNESAEQGWRLGLNYSRSFGSGTSVTLAGYRYSTEGYRELTDHLGLMALDTDNTTYTSTSFNQSRQFTLTMNQNFGTGGVLYLSGSKIQYRDNRKDNDQFQMGFSSRLGRVNYGVTYARQYMSRGIDPFSGESLGREKEDIVSLNLSFPLGAAHERNAPNINAGYTHSQSSGSSYYMGASGVLDDDATLSYGISASHDESTDDTNLAISGQKRLSKVQLGASYSHSDRYRQFGASARGALVLHSGGVTAGHTLGETFAIVEAEGAEGTEVRNSQGTQVDSHGYALVPSLTPYRYNKVTLGASGSEQVEILTSEKQVAPYAGSAVKVTYQTRYGQAVLFTVDGEQEIPMGADVSSPSGQSLGMVGQAMQAYVRVEQLQGTLQVTWGKAKSCRFDYDIRDIEPASILYQDVRCEAETSPLNEPQMADPQEKEPQTSDSDTLTVMAPAASLAPLPAVTPAITPTRMRGQYWVVAGVFDELTNASAQLERLLDYGFSTTQLVGYRNRHWIIVNKFSDLKLASQHKNDVQSFGVESYIKVGGE
ncbi:fimbria/pilus outer membrane usher protein [Vibrio furnissii]|uniref:fimbria/pilus outer membrane usher protein n=1 Tax=Vibrio furnissii TaxID=29494 RepID=UPI001E2D285C|nr:fimbria/pilus outer membrane usher protein [Vibrio furnissii]UHJ63060.1 fimbria/pilus outer membrane usher protein [Vibrio furnissii]